ncbi:ABC transporter ATP-binding protein [Neglectibacter caecimuris]|uniref:ABC transporter ATP-binding protein n=1 Tax=Neglectibacter caecimuris TaxID=3093658 RepID=UPI002AC9E512|nr:ABC transporter ATP-binding protein [Neglectibacter sp. M00184]
MNAISSNELSKTYPSGARAVDSLDLSLEPGEVFGFLGRNGAGKTTTVKLLTGMLSPTSGGSRVFGIDPAAAPEQVHALSGIVTEHAQMYDHLTGLENLLFYGAVFGLSPEKCKERSRALLERLELAGAGEKKLSAYSTGMRQRLSLARVLLHEPRVLFLDEPTSGLDPESARNIHSLIRTLAQERGTTVFLCTHQLRYAQEVCTRYGLMDEGRLLAEGTLAQLRSQICPGVTVKLRASDIPTGLPGKKTAPDTLELTVSEEEEIPRLVRRVVEAGGDVYHVSAQLPTLEEIYFKLTAKA